MNVISLLSNFMASQKIKEEKRGEVYLLRSVSELEGGDRLVNVQPTRSVNDNFIGESATIRNPIQCHFCTKQCIIWLM